MPVDRGVIATADELFEARHYPGVVALVSDALDEEPECVQLLVIRARAHIALRRDLDAQADLRDIIRLDPQCGIAYRLLGELAARRDENESAAIFFREALRLDPGDREASDWLQIVGAQARPAAVAQKLPAPAAAAGLLSSGRGRLPRARTAGDGGGQPRSLSSPARSERPGSQPRFAKGTHAPDEGPTHRMGSEDGLRPKRAESVPAISLATIPSLARSPARIARADSEATFARRAQTADIARGSEPDVQAPAAPVRTLTGRPPARPMARGTTPELPGFGEYLVETGILTRERLRAAQAYQRSMKVQLGTAIVTLGLASPQRIEWAAVAHQSQLGQQR